MRRAQDQARSATIESRALGALKLASCARSAQRECAREAGRFFHLKLKLNCFLKEKLTRNYTDMCCKIKKDWHTHCLVYRVNDICLWIETDNIENGKYSHDAQKIQNDNNIVNKTIFLSSICIYWKKLQVHWETFYINFYYSIFQFREKRITLRIFVSKNTKLYNNDMKLWHSS